MGAGEFLLLILTSLYFEETFLPNFIFFFSPSLPFFLLLSIDSESYLSVFSPHTFKFCVLLL